MFRKELFIISALLISACSSDITPTYQNESRLSATQKEHINHAWTQFKKFCPDIKNTDAVALSLQVTEAKWCKITYKCEKYGWQSEIGITATLGDEKHHYFMGRGDEPGIIAKKESSARLCGWKPTPLADTFISYNW